MVRICFLILLLSTIVFAQPAERARELIREYRYGQALRVLSSVESEEAAVLRFVAYRHLERLHDAHLVLKTIDLRSVSERESFDQVQFFLARGTLESNRYEHDLAEKNYREAIRRAVEPDDLILAKLRLAKVLLYERDDADDEVKELFEEASLLLPDATHSATLSHFLIEQAGLLGRSGLRKGAASLYFAALELSEKAELPMVSARCYRTLGSYYRGLRDRQKSREYQQKAIRTSIAEEEWEQTLHRLVSLSYLVEDTAEGQAFYKGELMFALDSTPPTNHRLQLYALLSRMGGTEAEAWAKKGLDQSDGFPVERVMLLKALAAQMESSASTEELLSVYKRAEAIAKPRAHRYYPALDSGLGQVRHDMAEALLREHRYAEALEVLDKAAEAEQEPGRRWHLNFVLNRACDTALRLGDIESARVYFRKSVEQIKAEKDETQASILAAGLFYIHTYSSLLEGMQSDPSSLILGISPIAEELLHTELKDESTYQLFIDIFNREIERAQASGGGGSSLRYRGILYEAAGRREEARRAYEAASKLNGGYSRHADLIDCLCLAKLAYKDGGWRAARDELNKSLDRAEDTTDGDYFYVAVGWAELELGNYSAALEMFRRAKSEKSKPLASYGMARAQLGLRRHEDALVSIEEALESKEGQSLALKGRLLSVKGDAARRLGRLEASRGDYIGAIEALEKTRQWASLLEAYLGLRTTLTELGLESEAADVYSKASTTLESVREQIEPGKLADLAELTTVSAREGSEIGRTVASDRRGFLLLQERLKRENPDRFKLNSPYSPSQLLSLREEMPDDSALISIQSFSSQTYISVLSRGQLSTREVGLGRKELLSLGRELRESLRSNGSPAVLQKKLYELLLKPVEARLVDKPRWRFVPSPEIQSLPLGALKDSQGANVSEERIVSLLSQNPERTNSKRASLDDSILLLGAPTGQRLKGARKELELLGVKFPKSRLMIGDEATTSAFLKQAEKHSIVHIASHASRKGVELHDKYLSLKEIFDATLSPGTLVVLSACETARSQDHASSLAEAFQVAGASSVVASLWKVDDLATAELFGYFYAGLRKGYSPDKALAVAQRKMQQSEKWSNPYFWSGFVIIEELSADDS